MKYVGMILRPLQCTVLYIDQLTNSELQPHSAHFSRPPTRIALPLDEVRLERHELKFPVYKVLM